MHTKDVIVISALLAALVLTILLVQAWSRWRKRALTLAGANFGFRRLAPGENLPIVLVPLIARPNRTYALILIGELNGYEAAFFTPHSLVLQ